MATPHVMLLNSGGLRSLVAAALAERDSPKQRMSFLFVGDGRANTVTRLKFARQQAEHFRVSRVHELELPHLHGLRRADAPTPPDGPPLFAPQLLLAALTAARAQHAERLIWPASFDMHTAAVARGTEQIMIGEHLAHIEGVADQMPRCEAPLIELSDQQIVELGAQMQIPWQLAWSCTNLGDRPCGSCSGCIRRREAFTRAGLIDSQMQINRQPAQV